MGSEDAYGLSRILDGHSTPRWSAPRHDHLGALVRWCVLVRYRWQDPKGTQLGEESELYCGYSKCCRGGDPRGDCGVDHRRGHTAQTGTSIAQQVWDERRRRL